MYVLIVVMSTLFCLVHGGNISVFILTSHVIAENVVALLGGLRNVTVNGFDCGPYCAFAKTNMHCTDTMAQLPSLQHGHACVLHSISSVALRRQVWTELSRLDAFRLADVIVTVFPVATTLELVMPTRKPIIVLQAIMFDTFMDTQFERAKSVVLRSARRNDVFFCSLSLAYAEFLRAHTGIESMLMPPTGVHVVERYSYAGTTSRRWLLGPIKYNTLVVENVALLACVRQRPDFVASHHTIELMSTAVRTSSLLEDLRYFAGVVYVPYSWQAATFVELYGMGVPLFVPSIDLLLSWTRVHGSAAVLRETFIAPSSWRPLDNASNTTTTSMSEQMMRRWLPLMDSFQVPFVTVFDSCDDLATQLASFDEQRRRHVSESMRAFSTARIHAQVAAWRVLLARAMYARQTSGGDASTFDEGMKQYE